MTIDRSKRITFENVAETYNEVSTDYPEELIEAIINISGISQSGRILEIGCGSGNATISFARRGYSILAIELGEKLAKLATKNCQNYSQVKIIQMAFEDWTAEEKAFDLVLAADSLHWIKPSIAYPKAASVLKDDGSVAFFWRVPVDPQTGWSQEINKIYETTTPKFVNPDKRFDAKWLKGIVQKNFADYGSFGEVSTQQFFWNEVVTTDQYIKGLRTFSMHEGIDEEARNKLYVGIRDVINQYGSEVVQPCSVMLFHAKKRRSI